MPLSLKALGGDTLTFLWPQGRPMEGEATEGHWLPARPTGARTEFLANPKSPSKADLLLCVHQHHPAPYSSFGGRQLWARIEGGLLGRVT